MESVAGTQEKDGSPRLPNSLFPVSRQPRVAYVVYGPGQRHKVPGAATNADCVVPSKVLFELDTTATTARGATRIQNYVRISS